MIKNQYKTIWTIGHSTRGLETFILLLQSFNIKCVVDIRHYPGSRRYPHFNKIELSESLLKINIHYMHLEQLGGRRKANPGSQNMAWRNAAFRGYADYMESIDFEKGIKLLEEMGLKESTAFMCSEAVWWRCHRSMVADYLKAKGWNVIHIMGLNNSIVHPYTSAAKLIDGKLNYLSG
ncbi:MAG: DUF488 domain-containing protein [Chitinophagaceae bacterium]|nr:DUF488 domain-containing protein [Chitinophagaceae bacterium]